MERCSFSSALAYVRGGIMAVARTRECNRSNEEREELLLIGGW